MTEFLLHPPTHRAIWGQCIGDALANHLRGKNASEIWDVASRNATLPFKKGQISTYSKQMLMLVKTHQRFPTKSPNDFAKIIREQLLKLHDHSLLYKAITEAQPYHLPDIEMAARVGPMATQFSDIREMLDCIYPLTKLMSTHPHAIIGTLIFAAFCWNDSQATHLSDEDLFHLLRNWAVKTELPSETWWMYEQATGILAQGYPLQEMLDFVNNITNGSAVSRPTTREGLSIIPVILQRSEQDFDWGRILSHGNTQNVVLSMQGCLMGIRSKIPTWQAQSVVHLKVLSSYPIQRVQQADLQLKLF